MKRLTPKPDKNPDLLDSWGAINRAAQRARRVAAETNTAIVYSENGKLVRQTFGNSTKPVPSSTQDSTVPYSTEP